MAENDGSSAPPQANLRTLPHEISLFLTPIRAPALASDRHTAYLFRALEASHRLEALRIPIRSSRDSKPALADLI
jgi:hypothetical protein